MPEPEPTARPTPPIARPAPPPATATTAAAAAETLYGRENDLALLEHLLDQARHGRGGALSVTGGAGLGKSTLLAAAARSARRRSMTVLSAAGVESESHLPFAGLHQLLLPLRAEAVRLEPRQRRALRAAFALEDTAPELFGIALATLELLSEAAGHTPVLLIADDTHWLDRPTQDVLSFVARRLGVDPVVVLTASRTRAPAAHGGPGFAELRLRSLDDRTARALLDTHAPHLAPTDRALVLDRAAGNPLALVELPRALADAGPAGRLPDLVPLNERLEQAFTARTTTLPRATRTLLLAAAAEGGCELGQLLRAASIVEGVPVDTHVLQPAVDEGLVHPDTLRVRFRHPLIRSAVYARAGVAERLAVHAALSTVLAHDPDRHVWQRAAATLGTDEGVVTLLEEFAARARARGGNTAAVGALEQASALTALPPRRTSLLLGAAELAAELGRRQTAADLASRADPAQMGPVERARLTAVREVVAPGPMRDEAQVHTLLEESAQAREAGHTDLAVHLLWRAASRCWWGNLPHHLRESVATATDPFDLRPDDPRLLAVRAYALPETHGTAAMARTAQLTPDRSDPDAVRFLGSTALILGDFHTSSAYMATAADSCRSQGRLALLARTLGAGNWGRLWTGEWDRVRTESEEAAALAEETGERFWAVSATTNLAMLAALRGEHDLAETLAAQARSSPQVTGMRFLLVGIQQVRGIAASTAGRHDEAFDLLRNAFDATHDTHHDMRWWTAPDLADAAVHTGRQDEARRILAGLGTHADRLPSPMTLMCLHYTRAVLADDDAAELHLKEALEEADRWPIHRARLLLAQGRLLRRLRRTADSRAPLRRARDIFDALGSPHWSNVTRQLLRAAGEDSQRRTPAAREQLSPQELQIATMAAAGLTNRQIGQQLFLSHRTVGSHLYRIFPKLGITTRTQLGEALRTAPPPATPG
ncbi:ATP-binding protein [Kitasatospora sp. NBC_01539]|uniref:ATP-binding protein n=1 Tax=Kitasatospora sp. NBC_01539 TaxID=2903577 RepID=UPI0038601398